MNKKKINKIINLLSKIGLFLAIGIYGLLYILIGFLSIINAIIVYEIIVLNKVKNSLFIEIQINLKRFNI